MKPYKYAYIGVNDSGRNTILAKYDYHHSEIELHCFIDKPKLYSCTDLYKSRIIRVVSGNSTTQLLSLSDIAQSTHKIYLFGGLGAQTGNTFIPKLSSLMNEKKIKFKCIVNTPFRFEGKRRNNEAQKVLKELRLHSHVDSFSLEIIKKKYGKKSINKAFQQLMIMMFEHINTNDF